MRKGLTIFLIGTVFMMAVMQAYAKATPIVCQLTCQSWQLGHPDRFTWALSNGTLTVGGMTCHSLADRELRKRVSLLPKGSTIEYHRSPLPPLGRIGGEQDKELSAFARFCRSKGIKYDDRFPVI